MDLLTKESKTVLEGAFVKDYSIENGETKLEFHGLVDGVELRSDLNRILRDKLNLHQGRNDQKFRITIEPVE